MMHGQRNIKLRREMLHERASMLLLYVHGLSCLDLSIGDL